jgi:hypothetical protein
MKWAVLERAAFAERAATAEAVPAQLRERISSLEGQIGQARDTIEHMEKSRFWQARKLWVAVRGGRP